MKYKFSDDDLRQAVSERLSIAQILSRFSMIPAGGNYKTIKARITKIGLDINEVLGNSRERQGWAKGMKFGHRPRIKTEDILKENSYFTTSALRKRLINEGYFSNTCSSCGLAEWLGKRIALELDHINGNNTDNRLVNLRILCPNCHSQTDTFRGRNRNRGRVVKSENTTGLNPVAPQQVPAGSSPATPINKCKDCSKEISIKAARCKSCTGKMQPLKINWPDKNELLELVRRLSYRGASNQLGVSDNAIRKRLIAHHGLDKTTIPRGWHTNSRLRKNSGK